MLGVRVGQFVGWQIVAVAFAVARREPVLWAASGVALAGCCLATLGFRRRRACDRLVTALTRRDRDSGRALPPIDVSPARLRSGADAGVAHDGSGFAVIVAIAAKTAGPPVIDLPVDALAGLIDSQDAMVSAVQLVLHAELAAAGPGVLAAGYRNLGYGSVPRSQSAWLALRHDPALSRYAVGSAGSAREVRASLVRGLAGRSVRALDVLSSVSLKGQVLDVPAARESLTRMWPGSGRQQVTYWLRNWPSGGIRAVQLALCAVPACSVTTSVLVTAAARGRFGLTATIRVTTSAGADQAAAEHAVRAAAASCGARLTRLNGKYIDGVLATLPLGRPPAGLPPGERAGGTHESGPGAFLSFAAGGVVIGPQVGGEDDGCPVAVPCFAAGGATRTAVVGDPLLHRLLGLRALGAGARLQVVTRQPDPWLRLRGMAEQADRMTVVRPGKQAPADGTPADPLMLIDDTGSPASVAGSPWLAVVSAVGEPARTGEIPPGHDSVVVQRSSPRLAASLVSSLDLPQQAERSLRAIPDGMVAIARPGEIRCARLVPGDAERSILARSMQPGNATRRPV